MAQDSQEPIFDVDAALADISFQNQLAMKKAMDLVEILTRKNGQLAQKIQVLRLENKALSDKCATMENKISELTGEPKKEPSQPIQS